MKVAMEKVTGEPFSDEVDNLSMMVSQGFDLKVRRMYDSGNFPMFICKQCATHTSLLVSKADVVGEHVDATFGKSHPLGLLLRRVKVSWVCFADLSGLINQKLCVALILYHLHDVIKRRCVCELRRESGFTQVLLLIE